MADYMLYLGSHGMEDPYRAALVFAAATAARDKGYEAQVALLGDGVLLMKDDLARHAKPHGRPPLNELIAEAVRKGVKIHCWDTCMTARGVDEKDLAGKAKPMTRLDFAGLCYEAKHVVSI